MNPLITITTTTTTEQLNNKQLKQQIQKHSMDGIERGIKIYEPPEPLLSSKKAAFVIIHGYNLRK